MAEFFFCLKPQGKKEEFSPGSLPVYMQHLANDLKENKYSGKENGDLCNAMDAPEFADVLKVIKGRGKKAAANGQKAGDEGSDDLTAVCYDVQLDCRH